VSRSRVCLRKRKQPIFYAVTHVRLRKYNGALNFKSLILDIMKHISAVIKRIVTKTKEAIFNLSNLREKIGIKT
jgi:hypothetical protein